MKTQTQTPLLAWQAPLRATHRRSEQWYTVAGSLSAVLILYGVLTSNWVFAFVFALVPALYFLVRHENHRDHTIEIYETGINFDGKFRAWSEYQEFWIFHAPGYYELHIASVKAYGRDICIQTSNIDPYVIRDVLGYFLPQSANKKEKTLDAIIRFCKL